MTQPVSDDKLSSIIEKIHVLRKIAQSSNSKPERESALEQATKLITKYQLDEARIEAETGKKNEEDDLNGVVAYETGRTTPWKAELLGSLSQLFNTYVIIFPIRDSATHRRGNRYRLMGKAGDIQITKYMFDTLEDMIGNEVRVFIPRLDKRGVSPERESWCLGCVRGYIDKMNTERQKILSAAPQSFAMVLVNRQKQLRDAYEEKNKTKLTTKAASKQKIAETYASGYKKGQTITVNAGLGGGSGKPTPLLK